jgi:hypothetical protein
MKNAVFFLAFMLLSISYLKAQPYITINNNTTCSLTVLVRAAVPACMNPILDNQTVPPGQTIIDATVSCGSCSTTGYSWVSCRVNDGCGNDAAVGSGSCNTFPTSANIFIAACAGGCGTVPVLFTPTGGGDATVDIN